MNTLTTNETLIITVLSSVSILAISTVICLSIYTHRRNKRNAENLKAIKTNQIAAHQAEINDLNKKLLAANTEKEDLQTEITSLKSIIETQKECAIKDKTKLQESSRSNEQQQFEASTQTGKSKIKSRQKGPVTLLQQRIKKLKARLRIREKNQNLFAKITDIQKKDLELNIKELEIKMSELENQVRKLEEEKETLASCIGVEYNSTNKVSGMQNLNQLAFFRESDASILTAAQSDVEPSQHSKTIGHSIKESHEKNETLTFSDVFFHTNEFMEEDEGIGNSFCSQRLNDKQDLCIGRVSTKEVESEAIEKTCLSSVIDGITHAPTISSGPSNLQAIN